jgi:aminoglycoside phosphotransferase (APT) family kinase protein
VSETQHVDDTIAVRDEEQLDVTRLEPYLREHLAGAEGAFALRQFGGGHANLTYLVRFGEREWVLRRPPLGPVPPGAHDMQREYRVLSTLYRGYPLAPRGYLLCTDAAVIGADFFVMERRRGIAFRRDIPEAWRDHPETLRGVGFELVDRLAELHAVDPAAVGLGELGNPDGYVARQVEGWTRRWRAALTPDVPAAEAYVAWLAAHIPRSQRTSLLHNDYKLDNVLLDANDPTRIVAVMDWDMCTRGEPLMDFGALMALWSQAQDPDAQAGWMPTWRTGFPTRREAVQRYAEKSGADLTDFDWYVTFANFRFAVIIQQIYLRYTRGQTHDERFADFGTRVRTIIGRGEHLMKHGFEK